MPALSDFNVTRKWPAVARGLVVPQRSDSVTLVTVQHGNRLVRSKT
jgi:hypothetical protein